MEQIHLFNSYMNILFRIEAMFGVDNAAIGFDAGDNSRSVAVAPDAISDSFGFVNVV